MGISTQRKVLVGFTALFLVLTVAVWAFFAFYFDDVFDTIAKEKLSSAVSAASSGAYQLSLRRISYSHGVVVAKGVELARVGYRTDESGMTVRRVSIDSVQLTGVDLWDLVLGHPLTFTNLLINDPRVYACWLNAEHSQFTLLPADTSHTLASSAPVISLDGATIANVQLYRQSAGRDILSSVGSVTSTQIRLDSKAAAPFTYKQLNIAIPLLDLPDSSETHFWRVRNLAASTSDSILTFDSIGYSPTTVRPTSLAKNTTSDTFTDFRVAGLRSEGIDFAKLASGKGVLVRTLTARSWSVNQTSIKASSKVTSAKTFSQNDLARFVSIPITIGQLDLPDGDLSLKETSGASALAHGIDLKVSKFQFDPKAPSKEPLFSKEVVIRIPEFTYGSRNASLKLGEVRSNLRDSLVTVASLRYPTAGTVYGLHGVRAEGIEFGKLLSGKGISLGVLKTRSWSIDSRTAQSKAKTGASAKQGHSGSLKKPTSFPVHVGRIDLPRGTIKLVTVAVDTVPKRSTMVIRDVSIHASEFNLDPNSPKNQPHLFSKEITFRVPTVSFGESDDFYSLELRNLRGGLHDSVITVDSLGYLPKFSEDEFAARHQYARGQTAVRFASIRAAGVNFSGLFSGRGMAARSVSSPAWSLDYFKDWRRPENPHEPDAQLANDLVRAIRFPITVGTIALRNGHIRFRERRAGSAEAGLLTFDNLDIVTSTFTTNASSPLYHTPMQFDLRGVFVGQAYLSAKASYALTDSAFNLSIDGTVGAFSANRLNTWLITNERTEATDGALDTGFIKMRIVNGNAVTTVTPLYHNLSLKVLPPDISDSADIVEGVRTFLAKIFVIRANNPDDKGMTPLSVTTNRSRAKDEELFQFIWFALRQSLGGVIGGFQ